MDMECDGANPAAVAAVEEKVSAGGEAEEREGLSCGGGAAAEEEEGNELGKGKLSGSNGVVADSDARSSDLAGKVKDGSRSSTPEVDMPINAAGQLTIFYAGNVRVFDGIPPEKVNEIMLIATAAAAANLSEKIKAGTDRPISSPVLTRIPSLQSSSAVMASPQAQRFPCKLQAELPITRRHSLQRFFEKRRDRLVSKNPYPATRIKDDTKTRMNDEASPDAGCIEKSSMLAADIQTNPGAHLA